MNINFQRLFSRKLSVIQKNFILYFGLIIIQGLTFSYNSYYII